MVILFTLGTGVDYFKQGIVLPYRGLITVSKTPGNQIPGFEIHHPL